MGVDVVDSWAGIGGGRTSARYDEQHGVRGARESVRWDSVARLESAASAGSRQNKLNNGIA